MLYSMTGFGNARFKNQNGEVYVEIKTLNSRGFDCYMRSSSYFNSHEIDIKKYLESQLTRGKVYISIDFKPDFSLIEPHINKKVFKDYYRELSKLDQELDAKSSEIFGLVSALPQIYNKIETSLSEEQWNFVSQAIELACKNCNEFRRNEGNILANTIEKYIKSIADMNEMIQTFESKRILKIKRRIENQIEYSKIKNVTQKDRLEQELVYYIDKLDITEERVRIKNHIQYFLKTMKSPRSNGRKLEFILQELNREANTISSKANCYDIQELVINIKDCIAKSKEQIMNIL